MSEEATIREPVSLPSHPRIQSERREIISRRPLPAMSYEAFAAQEDPHEKQKLLVSMIEDLGYEELSTQEKETLFKTLIAILTDIKEPSAENAVLLSAKAGLESPLGITIQHLPDAYRTTVDAAYMSARFAAGLIGGKKGALRSGTKILTQEEQHAA